MPRKAREGTNGIDPEVMKSAFADLDSIEEELASEKGAYMQRCQQIRARRALVFDEADAKGATKTELKALFKAHRRIASARKVIADLEKDQRDRANMMADALGNDDLMPLFVAASRRRRRPPAAEAAAPTH